MTPEAIQVLSLVVVNNTFTYLYACSSGLTPFIVSDTFLKNKDYCVLVQLFPRLTVHSPDEFLRFWEQDSLPSRVKREPVTAVTITVLLSLGAAGAGTGIASLVTSQQQYHQLSTAIGRDIQEFQSSLAYLRVRLLSCRSSVTK